MAATRRAELRALALGDCGVYIEHILIYRTAA
jgi:hypothetical protein